MIRELCDLMNILHLICIPCPISGDALRSFYDKLVTSIYTSSDNIVIHYITKHDFAGEECDPSKCGGDGEGVRTNRLV